MPETMEEAFAQAVTLHQNGNLEEAEDIYRAVLDADPEHADATNLLCVLAADRGYHDDAIDLIGQAIEYQPENPFYFFSLGNGFFTPLLAQISEELRGLMPNVFGDHRLNQAWGYKYNTHPQGIKEHADFAAVNTNFWITPDEANEDPDSGGLVVWDKPAPMD